MKIPCKDCIIFAMCNSKVKKFDGVYKTQFIVRELYTCSLFSAWYYDRGNHLDIEKLRNFTQLYNIRLDTKPDHHLAPTTYVGPT